MIFRNRSRQLRKTVLSGRQISVTHTHTVLRFLLQEASKISCRRFCSVSILFTCVTWVTPVFLPWIVAMSSDEYIATVAVQSLLLCCLFSLFPLSPATFVYFYPCLLTLIPRMRVEGLPSFFVNNSCQMIVSRAFSPLCSVRWRKGIRKRCMGGFHDYISKSYTPNMY